MLASFCNLWVRERKQGRCLVFSCVFNDWCLWGKIWIHLCLDLIRNKHFHLSMQSSYIRVYVCLCLCRTIRECYIQTSLYIINHTSETLTISVVCATPNPFAQTHSRVHPGDSLPSTLAISPLCPTRLSPVSHVL